MKAFLLLVVFCATAAHAQAPNRQKVFKEICEKIVKDLPSDVVSIKSCQKNLRLEKNEQELFVDVFSCENKTWSTYYYGFKSQDIKVASSEWECE